MGLKIKVTKTFAGEGIQIDGSPSKTICFFRFSSRSCPSVLESEFEIDCSLTEIRIVDAEIAIQYTR